MPLGYATNNIDQELHHGEFLHLNDLMAPMEDSNITMSLGYPDSDNFVSSANALWRQSNMLYQI